MSGTLKFEIFSLSFSPSFDCHRQRRSFIISLFCRQGCQMGRLVLTKDDEVNQHCHLRLCFPCLIPATVYMVVV